MPPLQGLTVPRGELTGLTLQSRLMLTVVRALQKLDHPPVWSIMLVDSKCAISSVNTLRSLLPYFQNRVSEIKDNISLVRKICQMEDVSYVESELNPSDLSTRATATLRELGPDSVHQVGPYFLSLGRSDWPVSQVCSPEYIPETEFRARDKLVFTAAARSVFCNSSTSSRNPWIVVEELLSYSNSLPKILRILARYLRGVSSNLRKSGDSRMENPVAYALIQTEPSRSEIQRAEKTITLARQAGNQRCS